jgi:hypothetical protein
MTRNVAPRTTMRYDRARTSLDRHSQLRESGKHQRDIQHGRLSATTEIQPTSGLEVAFCHLAVVAEF